jgi:putative endonuclease
MPMQLSWYPPATQAELARRCGRGALPIMYYTYVLESSIDGSRYIGFSSDLQNRLKAHNSGAVPATKAKRPWRFVYYEACENEQKAIAREKYFKTGFGRRFLKERL